MSAMDNNAAYEQIAHLLIAGVSHEEAACVLDVTVEDIQQLIALEAYKKVESTLRIKNLKSARDINAHWDDLERRSLENIAEIVRYNHDPDFNLRVAAVSNKAVRKRVGGNNAIEGNSSMRATIALPAIFINKLQQNGGQLNFTGNRANLQQAKVDMLTPAAVEIMLAASRPEGDDYLPQFELAK